MSTKNWNRINHAYIFEYLNIVPLNRVATVLSSQISELCSQCAANIISMMNEIIGDVSSIHVRSVHEPQFGALKRSTCVSQCLAQPYRCTFRQGISNVQYINTSFKGMNHPQICFEFGECFSIILGGSLWSAVRRNQFFFLGPSFDFIESNLKFPRSEAFASLKRAFSLFLRRRTKKGEE